MSSHLIANDTVYQLDTGTSIPVCVCVDCGQIADNFGTVCCSPTAENKEPALSLTVHRYISLGVLATCSLCFRSFLFFFFTVVCFRCVLIRGRYSFVMGLNEHGVDRTPESGPPIQLAARTTPPPSPPPRPYDQEKQKRGEV